MNQPQIQEYPITYSNYINLVKEDVLAMLTQQATDFPNFLLQLLDKADYAYAPNKWTIKELVGHMIDTERIMVYRLTCFARNEEQALPGFDEDDYVKYANFANRNLEDLAEEFALLRKANLHLINSLTTNELDKIGNANGHIISVKALVFVLAGHVIHHTNLIKERYL